jgi:hypothetical protein
MAIGADTIAVDALTEVAMAGYFSNGPMPRLSLLAQV